MTRTAQDLPGGLEPGTRSALLQVAASQIGYQEGRVGDDWNNDNAYGVWYPMNFVAWCAIFVSWCADHAGIDETIIPHYAYTPSGADWFDSRGQLSQGDPQAGDVGFVYYTSLGRIGHTFIVERVLDDGRLQTIEGNTNTSGSSQGDGVYRLNRSVHSGLYFGHPAFAGSAEGMSQLLLPKDDDMQCLIELAPGQRRYLPANGMDNVSISHPYADIPMAVYLLAEDGAAPEGSDPWYEPAGWVDSYGENHVLALPKGLKTSPLRGDTRGIDVENRGIATIIVRTYTD